MIKNFSFLFLLLGSVYTSMAQDKLSVHGNFQLDFQQYQADSTINSVVPDAQTGFNAYANINYNYGNFSAITRFESYLPGLQGYNAQNAGTGLAFKQVSYRNDLLDLTAGNFYGQFGNGLIFRSYEEKTLGYDNAMDGFKLGLTPGKGTRIQFFVGRQRLYFQQSSSGVSQLVNGEGIVRGADAESNLNELFAALDSLPVNITVGASAVSKFQEDEDPGYYLPENVAAFAGRLNISHANFNVNGEYAYKINDPSSDNDFIYKEGQALYVNATAYVKTLSVGYSLNYVDNMSFRSDRYENLLNLNINYIPSVNRIFSYSLFNLYPYAVQNQGELAHHVELQYKFKRNSVLGGKYGTYVNLNFTNVSSIAQTAVNDTTAIGESGTLGYQSSFLKAGDETYYRELNFELEKKLSKRFKFTYNYLYVLYNYNVLKGVSGYALVEGHANALDLTFTLPKRKSIKTQLQSFNTKFKEGNWLQANVELYVSHWFFSAIDQFNYQNHASNVHYYNLAMGYRKGGNRIQAAYGRQREGIMCVGGVCRNIPATNGFSLSVTSSF